MEAAREASPGKRPTLWFQDEARFGQKGRVCHRRFTWGRRPPGLCDRRYTWVHLYAAVRPATGQDFALSGESPVSPVLPEVSTRAMRAFLDRFAARLAPDEHAVLVLDQAGWHKARAPRVPDDVTLVSLPPYSPGLNSIERVWLYLRERHLSHRLLDGHDAIVDALCHAWKQLTPERLKSPTDYPYIREVRIQAGRYKPWRAEPDGALVSDAGRFRSVVEERGGRLRHLVWQCPGDIGAGTHVLLASGTESDVRAAMAAAEKSLAGAAEVSS